MSCGRSPSPGTWTTRSTRATSGRGRGAPGRVRGLPRAGGLRERSCAGAFARLPPAEPRRGLRARSCAGACRGSGPRRLRVLLPIAAALAIAALWGRGAAPFVAWELARDHDHCFRRKELPAQVWSGDTAVVTTWFEAPGPTLPVMPERAAASSWSAPACCPLADRRVGAPLLRRRRPARLALRGPGQRALRPLLRRRAARPAVRLIRVAEHVVGIVGEREDDVARLRGVASGRRWRPPISLSRRLEHRPDLAPRELFDPALRPLLRIAVLPCGAVAQLGARVNGIHEVMGSIPISSTNSSNNLDGRLPSEGRSVSMLCLFFGTNGLLLR